MSEQEIIDKLNKLLPQMSQQEKIGAIFQTSSQLMEYDEGEIEKEFNFLCSELVDDSNIIYALQILAESLVK